MKAVRKLLVVCAIVMVLVLPLSVQAEETHKNPLRITDLHVASTDKIDFANSYLALIPDNVAKTLRPHVTITFVNWNLASLYSGYGRIAAMSLFDPWVYDSFDPKSGRKMGSVIVIENRNDAIFAVVHEVGHVLDVYCKNVSKSTFWHDVYLEERLTFVDSTSAGDAHEIVNEQEFFASVFSEYMINRPNLIATAPKAYGFMTAIIQKYCPE